MRYLLLLLCLLPLLVRAEINVVTSIAPLQSITTAIMQGAGEPQLLIKGDHSAHHFAFRPSHFKMLADADLVIWIDRHFESGFQRIPSILRTKTQQLELLGALALPSKDGHIWYSPHLLHQSINAITTALIAIAPESSETFRQNQQLLLGAIENWATETQQQLNKAKPRYLLDHNFLSHFEADFGISAIATIHGQHDQGIGIKRLQEIEAKLEQMPASCLISNETSISPISRDLVNRYALDVQLIGTTSPHLGIVESLRQLSLALETCR